MQCFWHVALKKTILLFRSQQVRHIFIGLYKSLTQLLHCDGAYHVPGTLNVCMCGLVCLLIYFSR